MDKYNGMCVTIRKGKKTYQVWGVHGFEPMASDKNGVCLYTNRIKDTDQGIFFISNAKVIGAYPTICETDTSQIKDLK